MIFSSKPLALCFWYSHAWFPLWFLNFQASTCSVPHDTFKDMFWSMVMTSSKFLCYLGLWFLRDYFTFHGWWCFQSSLFDDVSIQIFAVWIIIFRAFFCFLQGISTHVFSHGSRRSKALPCYMGHDTLNRVLCSMDHNTSEHCCDLWVMRHVRKFCALWVIVLWSALVVYGSWFFQGYLWTMNCDNFQLVLSSMCDDTFKHSCGLWFWHFNVLSWSTGCDLLGVDDDKPVARRPLLTPCVVSPPRETRQSTRESELWRSEDYSTLKSYARARCRLLRSWSSTLSLRAPFSRQGSFRRRCASWWSSPRWE